MATIVNNPADTRERVVESDSGGWAVAVIVLLAVVVIGAFVWARYYNAPAASTQSNTPGSANINVTLPASDTSGSSGSQTGDTNTQNSGATNPATNPAQ